MKLNQIYLLFHIVLQKASRLLKLVKLVLVFSIFYPAFCPAFIEASTVAQGAAEQMEYSKKVTMHGGSFLHGRVLDPENSKLLFKYYRTEFKNKSGLTEITRTFSYPDGKEAVKIETLLKDDELLKTKTTQFQTGESGEIKVDNGKVKFSYSAGSEKKTDEEDFESPLVSGDQIILFLRKNWDQILAGKTLKVRFPVWHRLETVGFKFFKDGESKVDGRETLIIKMKPSSFVIAAIVDPLLFYIEKEGIHEILKVNGRTAPKIEDDENWVDLDAHLILDIYSKKKTN